MARCSRIPAAPRRYSEEQYLKSPAEMAELFADAPELLANSVEIAKRCSLEIKLGSSMLPAYPVPAGTTTEEFLRDEARRGLAQRLEESVEACGAARRLPQLCRRASISSSASSAAWVLPDTS